MPLQTINGMTVIAPWQLGGTTSIALPNADGTERAIHFIKSAPPEELYYVCEWENERYRAPKEQPPEGVVVGPIYGSSRGDVGWRLPGAKHGFVFPRIRQYSPTNRILQVIYSSRMTGAESPAPFHLVLVGLPIAVPPIADFSSVARTLQVDIEALRQRLVKMETEMERLIGSAEPALEGRVNAVEEKVRAAGAVLRGE